MNIQTEMTIAREFDLIRRHGLDLPGYLRFRRSTENLPRVNRRFLLDTFAAFEAAQALRADERARIRDQGRRVIDTALAHAR